MSGAAFGAQWTRGRYVAKFVLVMQPMTVMI